MKVKELMEYLEGFDEDAEVFFSYNYGDYWRTTVAAKVRDVQEQHLVWSEYHRMYKADERDDDERRDGFWNAIENAVVLG